MSAVYTFGYFRVSPTDLRRRLEAIDGVLCDIRYRPESQQPGWGRRELEGTFGDRYLWVREFGNRDYAIGEISLVNPARGVEILQDLRTSAAPVLMCVCREYLTCHRHLVAQILYGYGIETKELRL